MEAKMTKLSVIVPVYNVEKYLSKCLDSAIDTSLTGYEIIAVNDGSTDSSPTILREYASEYSSLIRVINQENGGLGAASNAGIEAACGEYIVFLDSDDYYAPGAVSELLNLCELNCDICFFDFVSVNALGQEIGRSSCCYADDSIFSLESNPAILLSSPSRVNKLYRKSIFISSGIRYPSRVWFEDYRTTPKLIAAASSMCYRALPLYNYLQQPESITHVKNASRNLEVIAAVEDILEYYRNAGLYEKYFRELEYSAYYNELLTSSTRVNLIDCSSPVQDELLSWFITHFPDYRSNPYFQQMPSKYRLIHFLIIHRLRYSLHALMTFNNRIKKKGI